MKLISFILLIALIMSVAFGCDNGIEYHSSRDPFDYSVEQEIKNLVNDGEFAEGGKDWVFEGKSSVAGEASKGIFDSNSIVFTGEGKALYTIKDVEPGTYSLRYFLKGQGDIVSAEMNVQVDGKGVLKVPYHPYDDWFEYASGAIVLEKKSVITLIMQVKGESEVSSSASSGGDLSSGDSGAKALEESTVRLYLDNVRLLKLPDDANPEPYVGDDPVSLLAKRDDGSYYMEVNKAPCLNRRVDIGFIDENFEMAVARAAQAGFEIFTVTLPWRDVQSTNNKNSLTFEKIDLILAAAEKNNMKVDLVWAGSSYNGTSELAPNWVQYDHSLHSRNPQDGSCETVSTGKNSFGKLCIADHNSKKLLSYESAAVTGLIDYITKHDVDRRIVGIQLQHNPAIAFYASRTQGYESTARFLNELARIIKASDRSILVRVNSPDGIAPHFAFNTKYIDYNSCEVNSQSMGVVLSRFDTFNSRIPAISSGAFYANTPSQSIAAYLKGSALALELADLTEQGQEGSTGEKSEESAGYRSIRNLNFAVAKVEGPLVLAPAELKTGFNYSIDKPITFLNEIKECGGIFIKCQNITASAPVSLAFVKDSAVYFISDTSAYFSIYGTPGNSTLGSFSRHGVWTDGESPVLSDNRDGSFGAHCGEGQALKIQVINSGKPLQ